MAAWMLLKNESTTAVPVNVLKI